MDVYDFSGSEASKNYDFEQDPITAELLKAKIKSLSVYAELELKSRKLAVVKLQRDTGTAMYFAKSTEDIEWFRRKSYKQENHGVFSIFYLKLNER